jgi:trehalose synthase
MSGMLDEYARVVGHDVIRELRQLAKALQGLTVVNVNSTREGGGVAEILNRLVPLQRELGLNSLWETIAGDAPFFASTKTFHNALQGVETMVPKSMLDAFEQTTQTNAERLHDLLKDADVVFIHDPQPVGLLARVPERRGKWIWRCHIDVSHPYRPVWKYLRQYAQQYDASVWHLAAFAQPMGHPQYLIPPSIDPLAEKNVTLDPVEIDGTLEEHHLDRGRPIVVQVSRFDRFKDPLGVISAYRMAKKYVPLQLVLAGGGASDDPEGAKVLEDVNTAANGDPDIHVLLLPPDAHRTINALQRIADIVLQKSTREGFGLTVSEAMWKEKPVIGGNVGGIRLQVVDYQTGFLVSTPEGAANRIRYLIRHREKIGEMGAKAHRLVLENFLLTRQLRDYLTLMVAIRSGSKERIEF